MCFDERDPFERPPYFKETEAVELWSARLDLQLSYAEFEQTVIETAQKSGQRYTGFITKDEQGNVTSFTRTRYPRRKYGVATLTECHDGMVVLAAELGSILQPDPHQSGFRIVLGLLEGYDGKAPTHSADEVRQALPGAKVTPAEVFAVRHTEEGTSVYTEPVAIVAGPNDLLGDVYLLADSLRQERFTIEDFDRGIAYVVETRFCTEPD